MVLSSLRRKRPIATAPPLPISGAGLAIQDIRIATAGDHDAVLAVLENIAVPPEFQGLGLGQQLMAFVERTAREQNLPIVHLYTNEAMTENLSLYAHMGFEEISRRTEDGYRRVYFRKFLA